MSFVYIKLIVAGAPFYEGGFATVQTATFPTVGNLIDFACNEVFKGEGVAPRHVKLYVAESVDDNEPTQDAERTALSSSRLPVGRKLTSLDGFYLLAAVASTHVQGKRLISAHAPPLHSLRISLDTPLFARLVLAAPFPLLGSFLTVLLREGILIVSVCVVEGWVVWGKVVEVFWGGLVGGGYASGGGGFPPPPLYILFFVCLSDLPFYFCARATFLLLCVFMVVLFE